VKILLLRNDTKAAIKLKTQLLGLSHEVVPCRSVKEAITKLDKNPDTDVVISSFHLAEGTGLELLDNIRSDLYLRFLPVLMACDNWKQEGVVRCLQSHASGIIALPVTDDSLGSKISVAEQTGRPRILIIDDEELILDLLREHLETARFRVVTMTSAEDALEALSSEKFDAIVSDIFVSGMTGIQLVERVKTNPELSDMPVILITGHSGKYTPEFALSHGADGYLTKPFHNLDLIYTIQTVLKTNRMPARAQPRPEKVDRSAEQAVRSRD
jgi:CheY-like chemotaxis protein